MVARLPDHQCNLAPRPPPARRPALIALPTPPIASALLGDAGAAARAGWIERRCAELGGGDGPLPSVDLERDARPLSKLLDDLCTSGATTLVVAGGREQPGFARAVAARWRGPLERIELPWDALLAGAPALRDDERPPDDAGRPARALDVARRLGPWWGFVPPAALQGSELGQRLRDDWQRYWSARGLPDAVRCAVLGLDPRLDAALRGATRPAVANAGLPPAIVITGLDGAGKSTHAARLAATLAQRGHSVAVRKLYRQGAFLELADELGARTRRGAPLAAFRVSRIVKLLDSLRVVRDQLLPLAGRCDALLLDRGVETHLAAAKSQLGWELDGHPFVAALPPHALRFWLELPAAEALRRLDRRAEKRSADEHETGLLGYVREFERMARQPGERRLAATAELEANAATIAGEAIALLPPPTAHRDAPPPPASDELRSPPSLPSPQFRCAIDHAPASGNAPDLGAGLVELRRFLIARVGAAAAAVPEATWIEAHAAELLLALRTTRPAHATVRLWPAALARMEELADLPMVAELARLIDAEAELAPLPDARVVVVDAAAAFEALGFAPAGARRCARSYVDALFRSDQACSAAPTAPAS